MVVFFYKKKEFSTEEWNNVKTKKPSVQSRYKIAAEEPSKEQKELVVYVFTKLGKFFRSLGCFRKTSYKNVVKFLNTKTNNKTPPTAATPSTSSTSPKKISPQQKKLNKLTGKTDKKAAKIAQLIENLNTVRKNEKIGKTTEDNATFRAAQAEEIQTTNLAKKETEAVQAAEKRAEQEALQDLNTNLKAIAKKKSPNWKEDALLPYLNAIKLPPKVRAAIETTLNDLQPDDLSFRAFLSGPITTKDNFLYRILLLRLFSQSHVEDSERDQFLQRSQEGAKFQALLSEEGEDLFFSSPHFSNDLSRLIKEIDKTATKDNFDSFVNSSLSVEEEIPLAPLIGSKEVFSEKVEEMEGLEDPSLQRYITRALNYLEIHKVNKTFVDAFNKYENIHVRITILFIAYLKVVDINSGSRFEGKLNLFENYVSGYLEENLVEGKLPNEIIQKIHFFNLDIAQSGALSKLSDKNLKKIENCFSDAITDYRNKLAIPGSLEDPSDDNVPTETSGSSTPRGPTPGNGSSSFYADIEALQREIWNILVRRGEK